MKMLRLAGRILALAVTAAAAPTAWAQTYPTKPIRLLVGFPPGGSSDVIARVIAEKLSPALDQSVIVENRPGANGTLAAGIVAKAPADGYTLAFTGPGSISMGPVLYKGKLTYDPERDFVPVGMIGTFPLIFLVNPDLPVKSLSEFVTYAKKNSQTLRLASFGNGSPSHLAGEMFKSLIGVPLTHVPYKGSVPAMTDLVGGHVHAFFDAIPSSTPWIKSGRAVALGVTALERLPQLPNLPTFAESGFPGFEAGGWVAIHAPTGTPQEVVQRLNKELNHVLAMDDVIERLAISGARTVSGTPATLSDFAASESKRMAALIEAAGLTFD